DDIHGYRFSFAKPGYCFVSSLKLRTFFPNINESLADDRIRAQLLDAHSNLITKLRSDIKIDRLGFIDKAFGPLGAVEMRPILCEQTRLPSVIFRSYSWRRDKQPVSAGRILKGDRICVIYDVGISGGLINEFADYAEQQGAST